MKVLLSSACLVYLLLSGIALEVAAQAQTAPTAPKAPPAATQKVTVLDMLGKSTLAQIKQAYPGGKQEPVTPAPNSVLGRTGARTRYVEPAAKTAYYFNSRDILVRVATTPKRRMTKEELLREMPGLTFKKESPKDLPVAFIKQTGGKIVQGFYLTPDEREVKLTTYDYVGF